MHAGTHALHTQFSLTGQHSGFDSLTNNLNHPPCGLYDHHVNEAHILNTQ